MRRRLQLRRPVKCTTCEGTGSKSKVPSQCSRCNGTGVETKLAQVGPGMVTQVQQHCSACGGRGRKNKPGDECKSCRGGGIIEEAKKFEINLDKGAPDGHKVVLRGEAGISEPGSSPATSSLCSRSARARTTSGSGRATTCY